MIPSMVGIGIADWVGVAAAAAGVAAVVIALASFVSSWREFRRLVVEASYEAAHNLQHIAANHQPAGFAAWPDFTVARARQLLDLPLSRWTARHPALRGDIDHMIRNYDYIQRHSFDDAGLAAATPAIEYYVEHVIRFLGHAASFRGPRILLHDLGLGWLQTYPAPHVRFRWSQAEADRAEARYGSRPDSPLAAWIGSTNANRPSLGRAFAEMEDPPPEGKRPRLPRY